MIEIRSAVTYVPDAPDTGPKWEKWAGEIEWLIGAGRGREASAEIFKMVGYILDNPCSAYGVYLCRRLMDDFLVAFADWGEDN